MIKNRTSFIVAFLLAFTMLVCKFNEFKQKDKTNPYPIAWDVYGYFLYLPATFIYQDIGLENNIWLNAVRNKYNPSPTPYQYVKGKGSRQAIVYNIGYSFIYAPGFLIAHYLAEPLGYAADGFSTPYQLSLVITAFLLTMIGLIMLRKIALHFFSDTISALLLVAVIVGTNYFFQAVYDGTMPHNILFTLNCFIIWYTIQWHKEKTFKNSLLLALFIGLASICRPTELIWVLLPLFWNVYDKKSLNEKLNVFKEKFSQLIIVAIILLVIVSIQSVYYKYSLGNFLEINLRSERFSFLDPNTIPFLFSYKKGWLLYTPIMVFAIAGFYFLYKRNQTIWLSLFLFFVVNLFVVSNWECWWYGASFSQRPMVETYCMMAFPLGAFFSWIAENKKHIIQWIFILLISFCVVLNIFQTWQFLNYIIHSERMTKEYYWKVFGKTSFQENVGQYLSVDRNQTVFKEYAHYEENYTKKDVFTLDSFLLNSAIQYSPGLNMNYHDITGKSYVWVRASVNVYLTVPASESNSCLVMTFMSNGRASKYLTKEVRSLHVPAKVWTTLEMDFLTPDLRHDDDKMVVYYWNMGNANVLIKDLKVIVFEPKVDYE